MDSLSDNTIGIRDSIQDAFSDVAEIKEYVITGTNDLGEDIGSWTNSFFVKSVIYHPSGIFGERSESGWNSGADYKMMCEYNENITTGKRIVDRYDREYIVRQVDQIYFGQLMKISLELVI